MVLVVVGGLMVQENLERWIHWIRTFMHKLSLVVSALSV